VPTALEVATNMDTFKHWMLFFMIVCFLALILGVAVLYWVLVRVGRRSSSRRQNYPTTHYEDDWGQ